MEFRSNSVTQIFGLASMLYTDRSGPSVYKNNWNRQRDECTRWSTNRRASLFNCQVGMILRGATEAALKERLITHTSASRF